MVDIVNSYKFNQQTGQYDFSINKYQHNSFEIGDIALRLWIKRHYANCICRVYRFGGYERFKTYYVHPKYYSLQNFKGTVNHS